uniref:DDE Tnp4 domain-containing protein n=1 Tax=Brassica oleracea var. oleracea TaxID=109376 RepID=A0A0D3BTF9_BRAOL
MASSSHYHYHKDDDADFETPFEEFFNNYAPIPEPKERKNVFLSRETGKKATKNYGIIIFLKLQHTLTNYSGDEYFQPTQDAVGRYSLSPLQKCTAAIRQLAYGGGADIVGEYVRLAETTARKCLHNFTAGIIHLFGDEYLRRPTPEDLERLHHIGEHRGFPGMVGIIDCMHWEWKNCPTSWKGMYSRGTGKATIVLEARHKSTSMSTGRSTIWLIISQMVFIRNERLLFNLSNYHKVRKKSLFAKTQEAVRKDVERAFGVLQARFAVVKNPSKLWDKNKISNIMRACIILHNMIVEDERESFTQYDNFEFQQGEDVDITFSVDMATNLGNTIDRRTRVPDRQAHQQLKNNLIENIWAKFGHLPNNI